MSFCVSPTGRVRKGEDVFVEQGARDLRVGCTRGRNLGYVLLQDIKNANQPIRVR